MAEIVFSCIGILFLMFGYVIRDIQLISDYSEDKGDNKNKLLIWIGKYYFLIGILFLIAALLTYIMPLDYIKWIGYVVLLFMILVEMTLGREKYIKNNGCRR